MSDPERTLTFTGHLEELRARLIWSAVAWAVATAVAFPLAPRAIGLLTHPLEAATHPGHAPRMTISLEALPERGDGVFGLTARLENVTTNTKRLDQIEVDIQLPTGVLRPIGEGSTTGTSFYYHGITDPIWLIFKAALVLGIILALPVWIYQIWAFVKPGLKES